MLTLGVAVGAPLAGGILAAGTITGWDPTALIGTVVTPVVVVLLFLSGQIVPKKEHDRSIADRDQERTDRQALQKLLIDQIMPAVGTAAAAVARSNDVIDQLAVRRGVRQAGGD